MTSATGRSADLPDIRLGVMRGISDFGRVTDAATGVDSHDGPMNRAAPIDQRNSVVSRRTTEVPDQSICCSLRQESSRNVSRYCT